MLGNRIADIATSFSGSWKFLFVHAAWWVLWFALALDVNLLTLWVSLEAIVLTTLVLMSQNRTAELDRAALAVDRERHKRIEMIAAHVEQLEQAQFTILHHLEHLVQQTSPPPKE